MGDFSIVCEVGEKMSALSQDGVRIRNPDTRVFETLSAWFDFDAEPRLIIDSNAIVMHANDAAQAMIDDGRLSASLGKPFRTIGADSCLALRVGLLEAVREPGAWRRLVLRMSDASWKMVDVCAMLDGGQVLHQIIVRGAESRVSRDIDRLAGAFHLTAAETRVLSGVALAQSPKDIARSMRNSPHTVRAHLRTIYAKLGVRGLADLQRVAQTFIS